MAVKIKSSSLKSGVAKLASEFIVIVLGVLAALAVDESRKAAEQRETREQLVAGLISDLKDNAADYQEVFQVSQDRLAHCRMVLENYGRNAADPVPRERFGDAVFELGYYTRLETSEGAYAEMSASGTGAAIQDTELRLKIARHYSQARDQADLNQFFENTSRPYHARLLALGYSPADREEIDPAIILGDPQIRAILKTMEVTLEYSLQMTQSAAGLQPGVAARTGHAG